MDDSMMMTDLAAKQRPWYEQPMKLSDIRSCISASFQSMKREYVAIGYYLKRAEQEALYLEDGYSSIWEFAQEEYGLSKSSASRHMSINTKFSVDGNSPILQEQYKAYSKSQLQEMLYLEDEKLEQVNPEMRVQDIREMRQPKEKAYNIPYFELEGQLNIEKDFPEYLPDVMTVRSEADAPLPPGSFTIDVSDLLPTLESEESVAISQQQDEQMISAPLQTDVAGDCHYRPGYPCSLAPDQQVVTGDEGQCGSGCCWNCEQHGNCNIECYSSAQRPEPAEDEITDVPQADTEQQREQEWLIRCTVLKEICEDVCYLESAALEEAGYSMEAIKQISNTECVLSSRHDYNVYCRNSRWHVKERQGEGEWVFESGEMEQHIWNFEGRAWRSRKQGEGHHEQEEKKAEADEPGGIIDAEFTEVEEPENESLTDLEIARQELERANNLLIKCLSDLPDENNIYIRGMKLKVAALASLVHDLDDIENPLPKQEQPEMPILRNNDQRKEWLENFRSWPVWFEVPEASEVYYRYDLPDRSSLVICEYHYWADWIERYGHNENPDRTGEREYLLKSGYHYLHDCRSNRSTLVEKLKEIQKKN